MVADELDAEEPTLRVEVEDHLAASALGTRDDALGDGFSRPDVGQGQIARIDFAVPCESESDLLVPGAR
jgi:hypothetical protein